MEHTRKQLTLFINDATGTIENIRETYNFLQFVLIPAHVTLCREDEIEPIEKIIERLRSISLEKPLRITFNKVERFDKGKGVFITSTDDNHDFMELRKLILGKPEFTKEQIPHITLMHPRNSTCNDKIFDEIKTYRFPTELEFTKVSLIQCINGGKWTVLQDFEITDTQFLLK